MMRVVRLDALSALPCFSLISFVFPQPLASSSLSGLVLTFQIVQFAKKRADVMVEREDGTEALEEWKKVRLADKSEYSWLT
jgi:hypothetical protein